MAGDDPFPVKFGPIDTDHQQEVCTFHNDLTDHALAVLTVSLDAKKINIRTTLLCNVLLKKSFFLDYGLFGVFSLPWCQFGRQYQCN